MHYDRFFYGMPKNGWGKVTKKRKKSDQIDENEK